MLKWPLRRLFGWSLGVLGLIFLRMCSRMRVGAVLSSFWRGLGVALLMCALTHIERLKCWLFLMSSMYMTLRLTSTRAV